MSSTPPNPKPESKGGQKEGIFSTLARNVREIASEVKKDLQPIRLSSGSPAAANSGPLVQHAMPVEGDVNERHLTPDEHHTPRRLQLLEILRNPWQSLRDAQNPHNLLADAYFHPYTPEDLQRYLSTRQQSTNGFTTVSLIAAEAGDEKLVDALATATRTIPGTLGAVGFSPRNLQPNLNIMDETLTQLLNQNPHFLTLGPIGLDGQYSPATLPEQTKQLQRQLEIAEDFNLPALIFHNNAGPELLQTLRTTTTPKRLLFLKPIRTAIDLEIIQEFDCFVTLRAEITHPSMDFYRQSLSQILPQKLLLGSGNSFKSTHSRAGQFNASQSLPEVLSAASLATGLTEDALLARTNANFALLFGPA